MMEIKSELDKIIEKERKGILFIIFFFTLVSFLTARSFVWITNQNVHLVVDGYVIHHAYIGIILLSLSGFFSLVFKGGEKILAFFYGIGLGLIIDEFGFLVSWGNYWSRLSYDLITFFILSVLSAIFFYEFWQKFGRKMITWFRKFFK